MSDLTSGLLMVAFVVGVLAITHVPLGNYMAKVFTSDKDLKIEQAIYRVCGINSRSMQNWRTYAASVIAFSVASLVALFSIAFFQNHLPLDRGASQDWSTAFNTAASFVANTNWQSYGGETGASLILQMFGLTVQNFVSAGVGIAIAIALVRGLSRSQSATIGNFWVDLTRAVIRILLPISVLGAIILMSQGVLQNFDPVQTVTTIAGGTQHIPGGMVASQEVIKLLGTNGGGYFNANSAHPFENPTAFSNLIQVLLILVIPFALPRTYGVMVKDKRQGYAVLGLMATLWTFGLTVIAWAESASATNKLGALEGKEFRLGIWGSALFENATTTTSTGAVNSMHESLSPMGGGMTLFNMALGEISPGGVGSGLYGALNVAILAVFIAGLMVGRTPEFLGKTIGKKEITYSALYTIITPTIVLVGTAAGLALPVARDAIFAKGPHAVTEMMYAYTSTANNNGSAFAGLSADQPYLNITLGLAMLLGRFLPILCILALAGRFAAQRTRPAGEGTMPTHTPLFTGLMVAVALLVTGLTFLPTLALGPLAEALS